MLDRRLFTSMSYPADYGFIEGTEAGLSIVGRLFAAWDEYRRDGDRARLLEQVAPLQAELRALLERAARKSTKTLPNRVRTDTGCQWYQWYQPLRPSPHGEADCDRMHRCLAEVSTRPRRVSVIAVAFSTLCDKALDPGESLSQSEGQLMFWTTTS